MKRTGWMILILVCCIAFCFSVRAEDTKQAGPSEADTEEENLDLSDADFFEDDDEPIDFYEDDDFFASFRLKRRDRDTLYSFVRSSAENLITKEDGQNKLYSPFSLWMALHLLSDVTSHSTHDQIISGLAVASQSDFDRLTEVLWQSQYLDGEENTCLPGSLLCLDESVTLLPEAAGTLAEADHAAVLQGSMMDEERTDALRAWLNQQTSDLLSGPVSDIGLDDGQRAALFTTLYFRSLWWREFYQSNNELRVFHMPTGDIEREFMRERKNDTIYLGEQFSAYIKDLSDSRTVAFLLPKANVSPETMLRSEEVYRFLSDKYSWEEERQGLVYFSMPKLDCSFEVSMTDYLKSIGVTDVFDPNIADFSGAFAAQGELCLASVEQWVRVLMDEKGVSAAAITRMPLAGSGRPSPEIIEFTLDRPFAFAILGPKNVPLFLGVVNMP